MPWIRWLAKQSYKWEWKDISDEKSQFFATGIRNSWSKRQYSGLEFLTFLQEIHHTWSKRNTKENLRTFEESNASISIYWQ